MSKVIFVIAFFSLSVFATSLDINGLKAKYFEGEKVYLETCDLFHWCKIKNKNLYIKKFDLKSLDTLERLYELKADVYTYIKNDLVLQDKALWTYVRDRADIDNDGSANISYGYTKVSLLKGYLPKKKDVVINNNTSTEEEFPVMIMDIGNRKFRCVQTDEF